MDHEQFDTALDAAAKELLTDAPNELLKGVMYRIEKDAEPKRRFAFGRFTGFAAVAAALLIFISFRQGWNNENDMAPSAPAPAGALHAVEESGVMNRSDFDIAYDAELAEADTFRIALDDTEVDAGSYGIAAGWAAPTQLTELERIFYDYINSFDEEVMNIVRTNSNDGELIAIVEFESQTLEITVTREGVSSFVFQGLQAIEQAP